MRPTGMPVQSDTTEANTRFVNMGVNHTVVGLDGV